MKPNDQDVQNLEIEHENEENETEHEIEVEASGPSIASLKNNKVAVIAASSILITLVVYFLFFKGGDTKQENLVEVKPPKPVAVSPSDTGKSVFELSDFDKSKEDLDLLQKPATPEVPTLPILPEDTLQSESLIPLGDIPSKDLAKKIAPPPLTDVLQNNLKPEKIGTRPIRESQVKEETKEEPKNLDPRYSPIIVISNPTQGAPSLGVGYDNNIRRLKANPLDNLERTGSTIKTTYIEDREHTIAQGKLFTAVLETAINTEIPGFVRAIISRDVYGESGKGVLIPRGSRLFGSYSSQINRGQGRVEISWTRLIRPDGVDLAITFNAADQFGRSGIPGQTDNKYGAVLANSMLTSILAVGSVAAIQEFISNDPNVTTTNNPQQGTITTTGNATNQALSDVSSTIVDTVGRVISNTLDLQPVIRVPQGSRITVIVNSDIKIPSMNGRWFMVEKKIINLHLISDSTGETLSSVARAVLSQFEGVESKDFIWPLIRTKGQLEKVMENISKNPGIILYTILQDDLTESLKNHCFELSVPCIPVLSRIINEFSNYLGVDISHTIGRQHILDEEYFSRVEAISYTINHDDGQGHWDLYDSDIVIVGVSRTSKSPTSVYLSCRGYKTANIPFVSIDTIPSSLYDLKKPLIVGLTINPEKLVQVRQTRLNSIGNESNNDYVDIEKVKNEISESRKLFAKLACPIIDVTKRSVEETAAKIIQLLQEKRNKDK